MFSFEAWWQILTTKLPVFFQGVGTTVELALYTAIFGTLLGIVVALLRMSKIKVLKVLAGVYIEFLRGTPLLVQVLIVFYGLPQLGIKLPRLTAGTVALVINSAAYMAEIVRSGIQAIDGGQTEASRSLGMNGFQTMIYIILPQAIKNILPAIGNEMIALLKETSIIIMIGATPGTITFDLNAAANTIYRQIPNYLASGLIVGACYLAIVYLMVLGVKIVERKLKAGDQR